MNTHNILILLDIRPRSVSSLTLGTCVFKNNRPSMPCAIKIMPDTHSVFKIHYVLRDLLTQEEISYIEDGNAKVSEFELITLEYTLTSMHKCTGESNNDCVIECDNNDAIIACSTDEGIIECNNSGGRHVKLSVTDDIYKMYEQDFPTKKITVYTHPVPVGNGNNIDVQEIWADARFVGLS